MLLRGKTSKHDGDCYRISCLHSLQLKINSKYRRMSVKIMTIAIYKYLKKVKKTNKINRGECYIKVLFVICADTESLLEKIDICHNSPEKSSITK